MKGTVISLFDYTGNMVRPWAEAGYTCYCYDIQHALYPVTEDFDSGGSITLCKADLSHAAPIIIKHKDDDVRQIFSFSPCDNVSNSGAKHFAVKGLRALQQSIGYFATSQEVSLAFPDASYMLENPRSQLATYWRPSDYTFDPAHFTDYPGGMDDHYSKETHIWSNDKFVFPELRANLDLWMDEPDDRIHKAAPGPDRANFRSATPVGFVQAVFEANHD